MRFQSNRNKETTTCFPFCSNMPWFLCFFPLCLFFLFSFQNDVLFALCWAFRFLIAPPHRLCSFQAVLGLPLRPLAGGPPLSSLGHPRRRRQPLRRWCFGGAAGGQLYGRPLWDARLFWGGVVGGGLVLVRVFCLFLVWVWLGL